MENVFTRITAVAFIAASYYLYFINPALTALSLMLAWGFWRLPKLFPAENLQAKNKRLGFLLTLILVAMTMFSYLMVPLFHQMCHALDIGGKVHNYNGKIEQSRQLSNIEAYPVVTMYAGTPLSTELVPKISKLPEYGELQHVFVLTNTTNKALKVRLRLTISPSSATHFISETTKYNNQLINFAANEKKHLIVKYHVSKHSNNTQPSIAMAYTFFKFKD